MDIRTEDVDGICIVTISGDLDTTTSPMLQARLEEEIDQGRLLFIFELSATRYVSSMGLRVFLSHLKKLKSKQGQMLLSGCNQVVSDVLRMSGFLAYFQLVDSRQQAIDSFAKPE